MFTTKRTSELVIKNATGYSNKIEKETPHRYLKVFLKYSLFYGFNAAAVLAIVMFADSAAQAQSRGYWANDGCYYQAYGNQWQRTECRYYDRSGALVAQNRNGTFYWFKGRWYNNTGYVQALIR